MPKQLFGQVIQTTDQHSKNISQTHWPVQSEKRPNGLTWNNLKVSL